MTIDFITEDPAHQECVLYLVESGRWAEDLDARLNSLHDRIVTVLEVVLDGHLAAKYPSSRGRKIRIQVDVHDEPPAEVPRFVAELRERLVGDKEAAAAIQNNPFIADLRIVTGGEMGRRSSA